MFYCVRSCLNGILKRLFSHAISIHNSICGSMDMNIILRHIYVRMYSSLAIIVNPKVSCNIVDVFTNKTIETRMAKTTN